MASRKRIFTSKTLKAIDASYLNISKSLGVLSLVRTQFKSDFADLDNVEDYLITLSVIRDLLIDAKIAHDELAEEEPVYADSLEEFFPEELD